MSGTNLVHGDDLTVTSTSRTTLDTKGWSLAGLTNTCESGATQVGTKGLGKTNCRRRLTLSERSGRDTGLPLEIALGSGRLNGIPRDNNVLAVFAMRQTIKDV